MGWKGKRAQSGGLWVLGTSMLTIGLATHNCGLETAGIVFVTLAIVVEKNGAGTDTRPEENTT